MANIQIASSVNMLGAVTWEGAVTSYNASEITISNGTLQGVYTGNFTYDGTGNVNGTLTGYTQTIDGELLYSVTGLDMSAYTAEQLIESNQAQAFFQIALAGNDTF